MRRRDRFSGDLFVVVPQPAASVPGSMDFRPVVAGILSEMLRTSGKDRHQVAAEASRLVGKDISKYMLDGYTAETRKGFNLPAYLIPSVETACGSHELTSWLAGVRGGRLLIGREALDAELGRIEKQMGELTDQRRALREQLRSGR
jgi:hypothetical protein